MTIMEGRITVAQESRFQLTDAAGVSHLFTLGPWCAAEPSQLAPLAARQALVRVAYKPGKDIVGQLARRIDLQPEEVG